MAEKRTAYTSTLICTVGTSLLSNLRRAERDPDRANPIKLVKELQALDQSEKLLGAEINSNHSIMAQGRLSEPEKLFLCVSETADGLLSGRLLERFYAAQFAQTQAITIEGLQTEDPRRFRDHGLRNLVRTIADIVRQERARGREPLINATGGFKAQISFAGLVGQVLEVPVFYQFESFRDVIELPPLPISFSFDYWLDHFEQLNALSQDLVPEAEVRPGLEEVLLLREEGLCCLSSLGELFHRGYLERFRRNKANLLPPPAAASGTERKIGDQIKDKHHGRHKGLDLYLERLLREANYITQISTIFYDRALPKQNRFFVSSKCEANQIEGWYSEGKELTKFICTTTARSAGERQAAIVDLTERFIT